jgi:Tfp pilus assembly protein PilF
MAGTSTAQSSASANSSLASLYDGEPEVVFATEFPVESAQEAIARADRALANGDTDLALYMYVRAYDLEKDNVHALARIGEIHESRDNMQLATSVFTSILRLDPAHTGALQSLGLIYLQLRRHDEAQALLERAVAENPALWRAQNGIGVIADMRGEHTKASDAFNAALAANPGNASLLNNRGYSLYLDGRYSEAAEDFVAAAMQGAERAWLNLGLVRARQKKYSEAVRMMRRTVDSEVAYNDVGYIAMRQGDLAVAESYFRKAIAASPRYFEVAQRNLTELRDRNVTGANSEYVSRDAG